MRSMRSEERKETILVAQISDISTKDEALCGREGLRKSHKGLALPGGGLRGLGN